MEYRTSSPAGTWTDAGHSGTGTTHTVTGLTNGTAYDVRVRAVNAEGDGAWSDAATATPGGAPERITDLSLTTGDAQIGLSWTAPGDGGLSITGYDVEYRVTSTGGAWTDAGHSGTDPSHTITGLTNGTEYDIQVRAVNAAGDGPNTNTANATPTAAITAPEQVSGLTLTTGNMKIEASWSAPDDGGSAITGYEVEYRVTSTGGSWTDAGHNGTGTSRTIAGLANGTEYDIRVRAANAEGNGAWSDTEKAAPAPAVPGQVTGLSLMTDDSEITANWTAPDDGGSPITEYEVHFRTSSPKGPWTNSNRSGTDRTRTTHTIENRKNGTKYDIHVRAVNAQGNGAWSREQTATPTEKPNRPPVIALPDAGSIAENNSTATILTASASDPDSDDNDKDNITYSLDQDHDDNKCFSINNSGALTAKTSNPKCLDYERPYNGNDNVYNVMIEAKSASGSNRALTASGFVKVTVTDALEAPGHLSSMSVTAAGSGELKVEWGPPVANGAPDANGYDIRYRKQNDNSANKWR